MFGLLARVIGQSCPGADGRVTGGWFTGVCLQVIIVTLSTADLNCGQGGGKPQRCFGANIRAGPFITPADWQSPSASSASQEAAV